MKLFTFSLLAIAIVFSFGCSAENPICSTNFCAVGEVFPRSELDGNTAFSEVAVDDSVILAALAGVPTPVETTPIKDTVSLSSILADVGAGDTTYLNQTVIVTGYVAYKNDEGDAMVVHTNADVDDATSKGVVFWIRDFGNPQALNSYVLNNKYEFTVTILSITNPRVGIAWHSIWSEFPE